MGQCLRCNELSTETSPFCVDCQSLLLDRAPAKEPSGTLLPSEDTQLIPTEEEPCGISSEIQASLAARTMSVSPPAPALEQRSALQPMVRQSMAQATYHGGKRKRFSLKGAALITTIVLLVGGGLALFWPWYHSMNQSTLAPFVKVEPNRVQPGQMTNLLLGDFASMTNVLVTRDILQTVRPDRSPLQVLLGKSGQAHIPIYINPTWQLGIHTIMVEDLHSRHTVQASFRIIGNGPIQVPHLLVDRALLDMGAGYQDTNSYQSLQLSNTGSGTISWMASSNQSWLKVDPSVGIFSSSENIAVSVSRAALQPGNYGGVITIVTSTGVTMPISVTLSGSANASHPRGVLAVSPALLSFFATDGGNHPGEQVITLRNPGPSPLPWSAATSDLAIATGDILAPASGNHLRIEPQSGSIPAGSSVSVHVYMSSAALWQGIYRDVLTFTSDALNSPEQIPISLQVQSPCGITANPRKLLFSTSAQHATAKQAVDLALPGVCQGVLDWVALTPAHWLTITPGHGQLPTDGATTAMVDASEVAAGTYSSAIALVSQLSILLVPVQLDVSPSPTSTQPVAQASSSVPVPTSVGSPALALSTTAVNFSTVQGGAAPPAQTVTLTNNGQGSAQWSITSAGQDPWLSVTPTSGALDNGQAATVTLSASVSGLTPGTYSSRLSFNATDSSGAAVPGDAQTVLVQLTISSSAQPAPPVQSCSLQATPTSLVFTATLLQQSASKTITLTTIGHCAQPIAWNAKVNTGSQSWLTISPSGGSDSSAGNNSITVHVSAQGMILAHQTGSITITAVDTAHVISPTPVEVTLNVIT